MHLVAGRLSIYFPSDKTRRSKDATPEKKYAIDRKMPSEDDVTFPNFDRLQLSK